MCASTQPKTFFPPGALGTGGQFSAPTTYASNPQPTATAGAVAPGAAKLPALPTPGTTPQPKNPLTSPSANPWRTSILGMR